MSQELLYQIGAAIGQLLAIAGFFVWSHKRSVSKLDALVLDVEVIKINIKSALDLKDDIKSDHDNIIRMDERLKTAEKDLNFLHQKIREVRHHD